MLLTHRQILETDWRTHGNLVDLCNQAVLCLRALNIIERIAVQGSGFGVDIAADCRAWLIEEKIPVAGGGGAAPLEDIEEIIVRFQAPQSAQYYYEPRGPFQNAPDPPFPTR